ncbi:MAG: zinc ribbon domain-containing protein [Ruminococcus sp.]|nr:zinc ribbon domain-containing protein [Ruminococcus sp.]
MNNCPECGNLVTESIKTCPNCGYEINSNIKIKTSNKINNKYFFRTTGIVLCLLSVVMFLLTYNTLDNENYQFYLSHYEECEQNYNEAKENPYLTGSTYSIISSSYERMMNDDESKIWSYRIKAIIYCGIGIPSLITGLVFIIKKGRNNGIN